MKNIIVWFRNDLRIHDHPALARAVADADHILPVFIFDKAMYDGRHRGSNRNRFLLESLRDLKDSLKKYGADLIIREGNPAEELATLAKEANATSVFCTSDYSPFALKRDHRVEQALRNHDIELRLFSGRLIVSTPDKIKTKSGTVHKVFTPYYKAWLQVQRREIATTPSHMSLPAHITVGAMPDLESITRKDELSPDALSGGETNARERLKQFLDEEIAQYNTHNNDMGLDSTSRLSAYFHFGCLSPLEVETHLPHNDGAQSWRRQLAWRDFYHYTLFYNPKNSTQEYQEKYRSLKWDTDPKLLRAWEEGKTGYPVVDAAMRQLKKEGWMHNRARLIVGSFLTKDLWLDWRLGETYFMKMLIDGDEANNNGNWQWIASVGVDPAPVYRRLYNPSSQRDKYDPSGSYVRKYVPELSHVPDKYLSEPWKMPEEIQKESGCIIGESYPEPIVDHKMAREFALEQYRTV